MRENDLEKKNCVHKSFVCQATFKHNICGNIILLFHTAVHFYLVSSFFYSSFNFLKRNIYEKIQRATMYVNVHYACHHNNNFFSLGCRRIDMRMVCMPDVNAGCIGESVCDSCSFQSVFSLFFFLTNGQFDQQK